MSSRFFLAMVLTLLFSYASYAEEYTIFNPTPSEKMRPLNSERASYADYVTTIDPGHIQLEMSLFNKADDKNCSNNVCSKSSSLTLGDTTNLRIGITENTDIQIISSLYTNTKNTTANSSEQNDGFGDTTIRFKYSFSGNNGEKFGIAVIPAVKIPTNHNDLGNNDVEGNFGVPFAVNFDGWSFGGITQLKLLKDSNSTKSYRSSYYKGYANTIYVSKNFTPKFFGVAEYYTYKADISGSHWQNTANFILHYLVRRDFKLDVGSNFGLNKASTDLQYYAGITKLF